eukprot:Awhi_evm1s8645
MDFDVILSLFLVPKVMKRDLALYNKTLCTLFADSHEIIVEAVKIHEEALKVAPSSESVLDSILERRMKNDVNSVSV